MSKEFLIKFAKYAGVRAIKTFCQVVLSMIPVAVVITEVDWLSVLGTALLASILSVCTSVITGLPELRMKEEADEV